MDELGWTEMISFLGLLLHVLVLPFRSRASLEAEIVFLRHQLNVLKRQAPASLQLHDPTVGCLSGCMVGCHRR